MNRNLIVDLSNIVWVTYYANRKEYTKALIIHKVLESITHIVGEYEMNGILLACDSPNVWRKDIYSEYKSTRIPDENADEIKEIMIELAEVFNNFTDIPALSVPRAESDDIIACFVQMLEGRDDCFSLIYSNDGDFFQLLSDRCYQYSPVKDKGLIDYNLEQREFDMFVKLIRGDRGDNVLSAYPGIRATKLQEAWTDPFKMTNIMQTVPKNRTQSVSDVYQLNKKLIDLSKQPREIRHDIMTAIRALPTSGSKYSKKDILKFFRSYNLDKQIKQIGFYSDFFRKRPNF